MLSAPKFRNDLTMSRQETAAGTFFVVKDPVSGSFFRLREAEQFIARQFDGKTPVEIVRQRTEEKFAATLESESLNAFVRMLEQKGLLEAEETPVRKRSVRERRTSGSLLYLRYRAFDPDRAFEHLIRGVRWFFTPSFVVFSAAAIMVAIATTIASWDEYVRSLGLLYHVSAVPLFIVLSFLVVCIHECAHGLTCKHFGGEVHEIGFLLIYFQPALYCNVSDAWLFSEKSKRLWVGFAGPYFELFVWALATIAWRVTDVETWISYAALIVMTSSGIKTLFNFNPFLKLDGYYLLSDYLEIPNLRRKSFRYVGSVLKRLAGIATPQTKELTWRERRIYGVYGLVATVSSLSLLGYVLISAGDVLIEKGQPVVVLLSVALLVFRLRRRIQRLFGSSSRTSDPEEDGEVFSAVRPPPAQPIESRRGRRRWPWRRWLRRALLLAAAFAVCCFAWFGHAELRIAGPFTILPKDNADARAAVEGIIDRIYVVEGDKVRAGDLIARLSDKDLRSELEKTKAEIRETAARVRLLEAGPTEKEIEVARAAVAKAEDRLRFAQNRETRAKVLFEERLRPRNEYDQIRELAAMADNEVAEATGRLEVLLSGSRPEAIDAARAQMDRLETHRRYIEQQLQMLNIVSPATGIVATPTRQLKEMRHAFVKKGDLILKVYDFETVTAQILVSEKEIDGIRVGQTVLLRARAYPDREFRGRVTSIATSAQGSSPGSSPVSFTLSSSSSSAITNKAILVSTEIENESLLLKSEMTGHAKIYCGQRRVMDLVLRRFARTFKVELWSWW
jgi:putative peptide zinc metalloprotease protein